MVFANHVKTINTFLTVHAHSEYAQHTITWPNKESVLLAENSKSLLTMEEDAKMFNAQLTLYWKKEVYVSHAQHSNWSTNKELDASNQYAHLEQFFKLTVFAHHAETINTFLMNNVCLESVDQDNTLPNKVFAWHVEYSKNLLITDIVA